MLKPQRHGVSAALANPYTLQGLTHWFVRATQNLAKEQGNG
ncbi:hypothetical protein [Moraxella caviae]|nr:hypothetical protein [Moraxella caviae]